MIRRRLFCRSLGALLAAALLAGCQPGLATQQDLAARVGAARRQCESATPATRVKICGSAKICQVAALSAAETIQQAQAARAQGNTDAVIEAAAAGLAVLASGACAKGGW